MIDVEFSDPRVLRTAFSRFPSGVAAICAEVEGETTGLVASSFTVGVSLEPPLVLFAVQNSSTTWPALRAAGRIGVSILADGHDAVCRQLASKDKAQRFSGLSIFTSENGGVFLEDSALWLECQVSAELPAGDHQIVVLEVKALHFDDAVEPLVFHGSAFRQLNRLESVA